MGIDPGYPGDLRHLASGTVRWSVANGMRIVVDMETLNGMAPRALYVGLIRGQTVVIPTDQLLAFVGPEDRTRLGLPDLTAHDSWTLSGDNTLTPA
jgi:hypothetical protein